MAEFGVIAAGIDPDAAVHGQPRSWHRMFRNRMLPVGVLLVALSWLLAAIGPSIVPYPPEQASSDISQPPPALSEWPGLLMRRLSGTNEPPPHWFGTDQSGLDVFSRVVAAPRTDMTIALVATGLSMTLGTLLGLLAGYKRVWGTEILMRASDVLQSFPVFITAMTLVTLSGRSTGNIVIALMLVYAPIFIRLTRAEVMGQMSRGYVEAARAAGNKSWTIALRHVLPNSLTPSLIQSSATVGFAIILTSGLSFVGAGVRPPTPEWGLMIALGAPQLILGEWWPSIFPGLAMSMAVLGYALVGHAAEELYR
jgi:peptide/nickel transport system permease protein